MVVSVEINEGAHNGTANPAPNIAIFPLITVNNNRRRLLASWTFNVLFETRISTKLLYSLENL